MTNTKSTNSQYNYHKILWFNYKNLWHPRKPPNVSRVVVRTNGTR